MNKTIKASKPLTPNAALIKTLSRIFASLILIAVLVFAIGGRLDWLFGWLFVAVWGLLKVILILLLRWYDPALLVERTTRHQNTQGYDRWIIPVYIAFAFGTILVAALDGGRFSWSGGVPIAVIFSAYLVYLLSNGLASWAVSANPFFSSESRIQAERGQRVTGMGPYRYVRHPAYLASILMWLVIGLMMESWYAAIPGLLAGLMMLIRTIYEDRMLHAELTGYGEYAEKVRYRLFPGIW